MGLCSIVGSIILTMRSLYLVVPCRWKVYWSLIVADRKTHEHFVDEAVPDCKRSDATRLIYRGPILIIVEPTILFSFRSADPSFELNSFVSLLRRKSQEHPLPTVSTFVSLLLFTMFNFNFKSTPAETDSSAENSWDPNTVAMKQPSSPAAPSTDKNIVSEQPVCILSRDLSRKFEVGRLMRRVYRPARSRCRCSCAVEVRAVFAVDCKCVLIVDRQ